MVLEIVSISLSILETVTVDRQRVSLINILAWMFHEFPWRDREDWRATGQPQGVEPEAYLNGTSQGATPEDARLPARRAYSSERRTAISAVAVGDS